MNDVYRFLNSLTIGLIIFMFVLAGMNYTQLPESIPIHFNGKGEIDGYGSKNLIWLMPTIALITFLVVRIATRFGESKSIDRLRRMNSGLRNKSDDAVRKIAEHNQRQARWLNLIMVMLFAYILFVTVEIANGSQTKLNPWIMWGWVGLIFIPCIKMVVFQFKTK